jgi:23S rRNA (uracil1939-C5)-methyltransferase
MCSLHPKCQACLYSTGKYENIWHNKVHKTINLLEIFENELITLHPYDQLQYRKKVLLHVDSSIIPAKIGLIQHNEIININQCPLHRQNINEKIEIIKYSLPLYKKFPLKYILFNDNAIVLVLKDHYKNLSKYIELTQKIFPKEIFPNIYLHMNPSTGNKVLLKSYLYPVYGTSFLINDDGYWYHPLVFQQQISSLHIESINIAINFLKDNSNLLDLYCGIGIMSANAEPYFKNIFAIEQSPISIECAKKNAPNTNFYIGKVETAIDYIILHNLKFFNNYSLYINPPRSGAGEIVIEKILKKQPKKIAYLSCNPKTLKKDLILLKNNYKIQFINFFDFLPYTDNIETLVLLSAK